MDFDESAADEVTKANNDAVKKGKFKGTEEDFRNKIDEMIQNSEKTISNKDIKDKEKYVLSYKIDTLKEIRQ